MEDLVPRNHLVRKLDEAIDMSFIYEEVKDLEILRYVDMLVDGPFEKDLADVNYHWAGSTNQNVIDLHHTVTQNV